MASSSPASSPPPVLAAAAVHTRRLPRYRRFLITGGLLGLLAAVILAATLPHTTEFYAPGAVLRLALTTVPTGALLAGLIAIAIDRRARKGEAADVPIKGAAAEGTASVHTESTQASPAQTSPGN